MFNLGFGGSPFQGPQMGMQSPMGMQPQMGFGGQFGGGFIQGAPSDAGAGGGQVVYAMDTYRFQPKDRSGRRPSYEVVTFPVGPDVTTIWEHRSERSRRSR